MNPAIEARLVGLAARSEEITAAPRRPAVISNQDKFRRLSQEYAGISPLVRLYQDYRHAGEQQEVARAMLKDQDSAIRALAEEELGQAGRGIAGVEEGIRAPPAAQDPKH